MKNVLQIKILKLRLYFISLNERLRIRILGRDSQRIHSKRYQDAKAECIKLSSLLADCRNELTGSRFYVFDRFVWFGRCTVIDGDKIIKPCNCTIEEVKTYAKYVTL